MDQAASPRLDPARTRIDFAGNVLVLIEAAKTAAPLRQLSDLSQSRRAPHRHRQTGQRARRYAREVLEAAGLWDALQPEARARRQRAPGAGLCGARRGAVGFVHPQRRSDPGATSCAWCSASTWPCATPARSSKPARAGRPPPSCCTCARARSGRAGATRLHAPMSLIEVAQTRAARRRAPLRAGPAARQRRPVLALFGASGWARRSSLQLLAGLRRPDSANCALGGRTLFDSARGIDVPPQQRELGCVPGLRVFPT